MTSTTKNVLIGCLTAMAAALVLGVGSCVGFVVWLNRPGELIQPHRLMGAETTGYIEWTLRLEDPGCRKVLEQLLEASDRTGDIVRRPLPRGFRTWIETLQHRNNARKLRELFPMVAAWTVRPGDEPGTDLHLLTLSIEHLGNRVVMADWVLDHVLSWNDEIKSIQHGDETIHQIPISKSRFLTFFIRGCDLFFASDAETAERAVDRLARAEPPGPTGTQLETLLASTPKTSPLRGAILNDRGELLRVWNRISGDADEPAEEEEQEQEGKHEDTGKPARGAGVSLSLGGLRAKQQESGESGPGYRGGRDGDEVEQASGPRDGAGRRGERPPIRAGRASAAALPSASRRKQGGLRPDEPAGPESEAFAWATASSATLWGAFEENGALDLTLELRGADPHWASTNAPTVERAIRALIEDSGLDAGDADISATTEAETIRVHARMQELPAKLSKILESHMRVVQRKRVRD